MMYVVGFVELAEKGCKIFMFMGVILRLNKFRSKNLGAYSHQTTEV